MPRAHRKTNWLFPVALSAPQAARVVGLSVRKVRSLIGDGTIPAYVVESGRAKILVADLVAYIRALPRVPHKIRSK